MKRIHRACKTVTLSAAALGTALATTAASSALAATPAASVDVSEGLHQPSVTTMNSAELIDAFVGLTKSAEGVMNGKSVPKVAENGGELTIVLDPASVPGLSEAFAPTGDHSGLKPDRGSDASGNTVVFPTSGTFTSGYGMRWGSMHNGIDVANPVGTPIYSVMDGTVINSGPAQGYGNWIRVQHDDGSVAVYGHMSADQLLVGVGERVEAGQQISAIGNEGQSTGPHLHFEIHPDGETPVDPVPWFEERGITI